MKIRWFAVALLLLAVFAACHLHVHIGGTYNRDGASKDQPPFELVFPKEESKENPDAIEN